MKLCRDAIIFLGHTVLVPRKSPDKVNFFRKYKAQSWAYKTDKSHYTFPQIQKECHLS